MSLLDSGAKSSFISKSSLDNVQHTLKQVNIKAVTVYAFVEDHSEGRHDIIFGTEFMRQLGLSMDFKNETVTWEELTIPMRKYGELSKEEIHAVGPGDAQLPSFMQHANQKLIFGMRPNDFASHNYKSMVSKCKHLLEKQKDKAIALFATAK